MSRVREDFEVVHADLLRHFPELVRALGGNPEAMLREAGLDADIASGRAEIDYRAMVTLLERAAAALACPDFGLQLAKRQGGGAIFGTMSLAMKNARTLGEAIAFVASHTHAHSLAARIPLVRDRSRGHQFVGHQIPLDGLPSKAQAMEQFMLLGHLNAMETTGGRARVRRVLFCHQPLSPIAVYRRYFGCDVRFGQEVDGIVFLDRDLDCPIVDRDAEAFDSAASLIERKYPRRKPPVHVQARAMIQQLITDADCSNERVAAALCLHPRTLHRRLKAEGKTFQHLKDEVRRDLALYYIQQTDLDLTRVAEKLGYAENAVLSRSCTRWFAASPSQLRARAARA